MIIGIDLGTSNSLVGVWKDGVAVMVPNVHGETLTPSVVGYHDDGTLLVGKSARERLITHPHLTAATFKRYMGSTRTLRLGDKDFRPEEVSAMVLRSLKADAEAFLGESVTEAVITVPAYFNNGQRQATRTAGELAGLKVDRLLNEPTAAALAYGLHGKEVESKFLVFDLGGGTFDVSVLELFEGVIEVCASTGDNFLGGEDFVGQLVNEFMLRAGKAAGLPERDRPAKIEQALRWEAERVKRALTNAESAIMKIEWQDKTVEWHVTAEAFAKISEPLLTRLRTPLERALRDARIRASELDNVVLAGGATRMPMVRRLVATLFGRLPASTMNPDEVVAIGAATQAGLKMRDSALNEVVLTDVCPYTLGIEVSQTMPDGRLANGIFAPMIERNTVIPASRSNIFGTVSDFQKNIELMVYQGESRSVSDNVFLGKLNVRVPPKRKGEVQVEVRFTYDVNGLIEVESHVPLLKERRTLVIEESPGSMSKEEIARRLADLSALKIHPRDQERNQATLTRAARLFEQALGDTRAYISQRIYDFDAVLQKQNPSDIEATRADLEKLLDQIENDRFL